MTTASEAWLPFPAPSPQGRAPLTATQKQVLDFIRGYRMKNGVSPTLQEIGNRLKTHRVTIHAHVEALVEKRYLLRFSKKASRSLIPIDGRGLPLDPGGLHAPAGHRQERGAAPEGGSGVGTALSVPLVGRVAAGRPIEAVFENESLDLATVFPLQKDVFALEVKGDSMIDEQIRDGDFVLVERRSTARNGEMVVAVLPSGFGTPGEATLKRFHHEGDRIRLQPANPSHEPIYVTPEQGIEIRGVVVGVLRRYHPS
ncbi:MAG TPA: transcriptional repressor LexA [Planctomycetota bacterium]|nr:transcriptional repressor LexA [Planctomycetota bacterium]